MNSHNLCWSQRTFISTWLRRIVLLGMGFQVGRYLLSTLFVSYVVSDETSAVKLIQLLYVVNHFSQFLLIFSLPLVFGSLNAMHGYRFIHNYNAWCHLSFLGLCFGECC